MARRVEWHEVWTERTLGGLQLTVLRKLSDGRIQQLDPHQGNKVLGYFDTYEDAVQELEEDEWVPVEGRVDEPASDFLGPRKPEDSRGDS